MMKAEITTKTKDRLVIEWKDEVFGFGVLTMYWHKGRQEYVLDAENLGVQAVLEIFRAAKVSD